MKFLNVARQEIADVCCEVQGHENVKGCEALNVFEAKHCHDGYSGLPLVEQVPNVLKPIPKLFTKAQSPSQDIPPPHYHQDTVGSTP